ncbi:transposase [Arachidicoccus sp.]|jgi:transposase|uniref:transposase n=1 Tax=Arachidicoccus sp. TaxID=1872624 RepID=UPI003D211BFC
MTIETPDDLEVIGIDDYAKRKGIRYGSIIVNMQAGRAIDMIDSRETGAVSKQLIRYQKVNYVTRDRSSSYALGIRTAIAHAEQIADKFHLLKNFNDHIYKEIRRSYRAIKEEYLSSINLPTDDIQEKTGAAQKDRDTEPFTKARAISMRENVPGSGYRQAFSTKAINKESCPDFKYCPQYRKKLSERIRPLRKKRALYK